MLTVCLQPTHSLKYNGMQFKVGDRLHFNLENVPIEVLRLIHVKSLVPSKSTSDFLVKQIDRLMSELNSMEKKLKSSGGAWILEVKNSRIYSAAVRPQVCETPKTPPEKLEVFTPVVVEVPSVVPEAPVVLGVVETLEVAEVLDIAEMAPEVPPDIVEDASTPEEETDGTESTDLDLLTVVPNEDMKLDLLLKIAAARGIATKRGLSKKAVVDRILDPK